MLMKKVLIYEVKVNFLLDFRMAHMIFVRQLGTVKPFEIEKTRIYEATWDHFCTREGRGY